MEQTELIAFQLISQAGSARSHFLEALQLARDGDLESACEKIKIGEEELSDGHKIHAELIQKEAAGNKIEVSLLMIHAEDIMITTETLREIVKELLHMYKKLENK
jgi:cellobiose PTS system EIIA component